MQDATITKDDAEKFFKENVEEQMKQRGVNGFAAVNAHFEYQLDLFFISNHNG